MLLIVKAQSNLELGLSKIWNPHRTRTRRESISWLSCTDSRLTVSELSLIWVLSKLQGRSKQVFSTYQNQDQDAKPQSGTSSVLQNPKSGHKGHGCSFHLENEDREPKFGSWLYQRPVTYPNPDQNAEPQSGTSSIFHSPKSWLKTHGFSLHLQTKIESPNSEY